MKQFEAYVFVFALCTMVGCSGSESRNAGKTVPPSPSPMSASAEGGGSSDIGSGGDGLKARWFAVASKLNSNLRKLVHTSVNSDLFQRIQENFGKTVSDSKVEFKSYPLILGVEKADEDNPDRLKFPTPFSCNSELEAHNDSERHAINFASHKLIKASIHRINCYDPFGKDLQRLVLHEYLGLMGIYETGEGDIDYEITNLLLKDMETLVQFEFDSGLDVIPISTCDELQNKVGLKKEPPLFPYAGQARSEVRSVSDFHYNPKKIYRLTNNIDCSNSTNWNEGDGFSPIFLDGHLDGNGFTISSLNIQSPKGELKMEGRALFQKTCIRCQIAHLKIKGMVGEGSALLVSVHSGEIRHVDLEGSLTKTEASIYHKPYSNEKGWYQPAGGMVGVNSGGSIRFSKIDVEIESIKVDFGNGVSANLLGCVVGLNLVGLIASTAVNCHVKGSGVLGGVTGYNQWGVIKNSSVNTDIQDNV